jgi:hypothetical protein
MSAQGEGLTKNIESLQQPLPDLLSEYGSEQISLYGVTGTPEELIKMCPVPHENMTTEAKNMFLVMAMNESEVMVKQEHMPYFKEVTQSRGVELKVAARQESEHSSTKSTSAETLLNSLSSNSTEEAIEQHTETLAKTEHAAIALEARNKEQEESLHAQNEKVFEDSSDYLPEEVLTQDETTTERMDEWLTQLRLEYETRELANKIEADVEQSQIIQEEEMSEVAAAKPQENQQSDEYDELRHQVEAETKDAEPKVATKPLKVQGEGLAFKEQSTADTNSRISRQQSLFPEDVPAVFTKNEEAPLSIVEEASSEGGAKTPLIDEDLENNFASADEGMSDDPFYPAESFKNTADIAQVTLQSENEKDDLETISFAELLTDAQEFYSVEPSDLLGEIGKYIDSDEALENTDKLNAKSLITEIESKTRELTELYSSSKEVSPEETDELEELLKEACTELFVCLGIRQDEETLDRFINTIVQQQKSSEIGEDTADKGRQYLSEEERTSELKSTFFFKLSFSQIETTSLRLLGYFAIKDRRLVV